MDSLCIVVHLYVSVNNVKVFSAAMEVQKWVPFVSVAVNNVNGFSAAMEMQQWAPFVYVTVNNVKGFSAAMEVQQWVPFVCVTVNNVKGFSGHGNATMGSLRMCNCQQCKRIQCNGNATMSLPSQSCQQYHRARVFLLRFQ